MWKNISFAIHTLILYALLIASSHAGGLVLYGAITEGGDTLATSFDEDGDDVADLKAGGLFHLAAGYERRIESLGLRVTAGYKFDTLNADNGDADFSRLPLEAVVYGRLAERHCLGGGLVIEMSPTFEMSVDGGGSLDIDFDDATGFMVFYGYSIGAVEWGVRYTNIEYQADFIDAVDASSFGLYVSSFFGN